MTQQHRDPPPAPGLHLVKTYDGASPSREESAMADDVVDILQSGLRGSTDTDTGAVEETYVSTLAADEARRIEHEFFQALARRVRERLTWTSGKQGLGICELGNRDGWRFSVRDKEGRPFEVEVSFSSIAQIAQQQRKATFGNFHRVLDSICDQLRDARVAYIARVKSLEVH